MTSSSVSLASGFLRTRRQPRIEPFGASGGFTVTYPRSDRQTLAELRRYQQVVREEAPGWTSRLDFDASDNTCTLHVFPVSALPFAVLSKPNRYGL